MLRFSDGINIDTSGPLRTLTLHDGHYVVGGGVLIPVNSLEEARAIIAKKSGSPRDPGVNLDQLKFTSSI
jgi:hypothetical protein